MSRLKSATLTMGDPAPALELLDVGGAPHTLDGDRAGGPALVVFSPGSWSPNTRRLVEGLLATHETFRRQGITLLLVVTENPRTAQRLVPEDGPLFPILIDQHRQAARDYGVFRAFSIDGIGVTRPAAFLVDGEGLIRFAYVGQRDGDVLEPENMLYLTAWLIARSGVEVFSAADVEGVTEVLGEYAAARVAPVGVDEQAEDAIPLEASALASTEGAPDGAELVPVAEANGHPTDETVAAAMAPPLVEAAEAASDLADEGQAEPADGGDGVDADLAVPGQDDLPPGEGGTPVDADAEVTAQVPLGR